MTKITTAAILLLATALGSSNASGSIVVGPGFGTPCAEGGCPVFGGSVNGIGTHSLDLFQSSSGPAALNGFFLILAVPNNPANALTANPITGAQLHIPATNAASTPVTVGSLSPETLFTHGDLYSALFSLTGSSIPFSQIQSAEYALFPSSFNPATNPVVNFSLYEIPLTANPAFASNDLVDITFTTLPIGTFVLGYGTPSLSVTDTPFAQAGVFGLATAVPEPASLGLLSSALLCLQWRRRRRASRYRAA
jgi:PEP-CTERM motif